VTWYMDNRLLLSAVGGCVMALLSVVDGHVIRHPDKYEFSSAASANNPIKSDSFIIYVFLY
jgi:uncharacterized membrane protein